MLEVLQLNTDEFGRGKREDLAKEFLLKQAKEVNLFVLQEVTEAQALDLQNELKVMDSNWRLEYARRGVGDEVSDKNGHGIVLAVRESRDLYIVSYGQLQIAVPGEAWIGGVLQVVELMTPGGPVRGVTTQGPTVVGEDTKRDCQQRDWYFGCVTGSAVGHRGVDMPILVAGDFNTFTTGVVAQDRLIDAMGAVNVMEEMGINDMRTPEFHEKRKRNGWPPQYEADQIFLAGIALNYFDVMYDVQFSDHFPLRYGVSVDSAIQVGVNGFGDVLSSLDSALGE